MITNLRNLQDPVKAVFKGKLIALNVHIRKERSKINYLSFHFMELENQEQIKPKVNKRKEIIKIRAKKLKEKRNIVSKVKETNSWCFGKNNEIGKSLGILTKRKAKDPNYQCCERKRDCHRE